MAKTDLLKQAIADATEIQKVAIENAKKTLSESFDSKLKSMLAAKLDEDSDENQDEYQDEYEQQDEAYDENEEEKDEAFELDEKKHSEEETDKEEEDTDEGAEMDDSEQPEETDEEYDLDAILAEMELEEGEDEGEEPAEEPKPETEEEPVDEMAKGEEKEEKEKKMDEENLNEISQQEIVDFLQNNYDLSPGEAGGAAAFIFAGGALLFKAVKAAVGKYKENPEAYKLNTLMGWGKLLKDVATKPTVSKSFVGEDEDINLESLVNEISDSKKSSEAEELKRQTEELTSKINEVNLLNAKLLYLNKILAENDGLTAEQKIKLISTFDQASTVKEVKLVHQTISEAFKVKQTKSKSQLKESVKAFASTPSGDSKKMDSPVENNQLNSLWQKIRKN